MNTKQKITIIKEYYRNELSMQEIADLVGEGKQKIHSWISFMKRKGVIQNTKREVLKPEDIDKALEKLPKEEIIVNEKGVKCNTTLARTCRFGTANNTVFLCNFMACTGQSRLLISPNPKDCHCYQKITRDNPRIEGRF